MASASQCHMNSLGAPVRIPRLSYRIKSSDVESINTISTDASRTTVSTNPTSPLHSTFCPSPREPPSDMLSPISSRRPSIAPSSQTSRLPKTPTKKKSSFFSGLFSAKEPSAQAFTEYQKTLLKHGQGRANNVGLPGVSSAKLPSTVPKVNSKWDGVPQTLKENEKQQDLTGRRSTAEHSRGTSTSRPTMSSEPPRSEKRMSRGTLRGTSTYSSSSNHLVELYGWERTTMSSSSSAVIDFASEHRPSTSRLQTSHSAPPLSERPPPLPPSMLFPPHSPPIPPSPAPSHPDQTCPSLSHSPSSPAYSSSLALTPYESLPVTPDAPSPMTPLTSPILDVNPQDSDIRTTVIKAPAVTDHVIVRSAGVNILGPPATAKKRNKPSPYQYDGIRPKISGLDMQLQSILKKDSTSETPSPRPTLSTYNASPKAASSASPPLHNRQHSAHERLGLGVSMKNTAIVPWLAMDPAGSDDRNVTPTPSEGAQRGQHLRRKSRISLFKK